MYALVHVDVLLLSYLYLVGVIKFNLKILVLLITVNISTLKTFFSGLGCKQRIIGA